MNAPLIDVGPRTAGAELGMCVREISTGKRGEVIEIGEAGRCCRICLHVGDVAVGLSDGRIRVCGPMAYFWTQFEPIEKGT